MDFQRLNINEGGQMVSRLPPSDEEIGALEKNFGLIIPQEYLDLLRFSNGGHPELDCYDPNGQEDESSFAVNKFFHLDGDRDAFNNLWRETAVWRPYIGDGSLPIASDGGGNILFLDLSSSMHPVKVCWHDEQFLIGEMASTLADFIAGLNIPEDYI